MDCTIFETQILTSAVQEMNLMGQLPNRSMLALSWDEQVQLSSLKATYPAGSACQLLAKRQILLLFQGRCKQTSTHHRFGIDEGPKKQFHSRPA